MKIRKETYKEMNQTTKLDVIFDYVSDIHTRIETLEKCMEARKISMAIISLIGGALGTITIFVGKFFFIK